MGNSHYIKLCSLIPNATYVIAAHILFPINSRFSLPRWLSTYPSCFYFVSRGTAPSFAIWKDFTFLSLQTWLHMTPPFLFHYGCYEEKEKLT